MSKKLLSALALIAGMGGMGSMTEVAKMLAGPPNIDRRKAIDEYKLIKAKQSKLSASERANVVWWVERYCKPEELV